MSPDLGIGNKEWQKIAADFCVPYEEWKTAHTIPVEEEEKAADQARQLERQRNNRFEETQKRFISFSQTTISC